MSLCVYLSFSLSFCLAAVHYINELFHDLAILVHQQQEHLDTIENSVQATKVDTEKGKEDLESAQEYAKSGRKV
jgi:t-SNARE complex subunit (syntaxin)